MQQRIKSPRVRGSQKNTTSGNLKMQEIERATFVSFAAIRPYSVHDVQRDRLSYTYSIIDLMAQQISIGNLTKNSFSSPFNSPRARGDTM